LLNTRRVLLAERLKSKMLTVEENMAQQLRGGMSLLM